MKGGWPAYCWQIIYPVQCPLPVGNAQYQIANLTHCRDGSDGGTPGKLEQMEEL